MYVAVFEQFFICEALSTSIIFNVYIVYLIE